MQVLFEEYNHKIEKFVDDKIFKRINEISSTPDIDEELLFNNENLYNKLCTNKVLSNYQEGNYPIIDNYPIIIFLNKILKEIYPDIKIYIGYQNYLKYKLEFKKEIHPLNSFKPNQIYILYTNYSFLIELETVFKNGTNCTINFKSFNNTSNMFFIKDNKFKYYTLEQDFTEINCGGINASIFNKDVNKKTNTYFTIMNIFKTCLISRVKYIHPSIYVDYMLYINNDEVINYFIKIDKNKMQEKNNKIKLYKIQLKQNEEIIESLTEKETILNKLIQELEIKNNELLEKLNNKKIIKINSIIDSTSNKKINLITESIKNKKIIKI